jgi:hypothetical protein
MQIAGMGKEINACSVLIRKSYERTPLGRLRHIGEDHVKTDHKETHCEDIN